MERIETVIIGGGQAGLAMSYHLSRIGREHVILEEKWPGHRWRTERWDAFALQAPNWTLQLPGYTYQGDDPMALLDATKQRDSWRATRLASGPRCDAERG